jgi:hypothetical protein
MSSLFIHISPAFVTWSLQWHWGAVEAQWPGLFGADHADEVTFTDLFTPAAAVYVAWWVPFTLWMLASGRFHSPKATGWDTVYVATLKGNGGVRWIVGLGADEVDTRASDVLPTMRYMMVHAALCFACIALSYPLYHSRVLHTVFCVGLFCASAWNGAVRYDKMMTRYYESRLEKLLKEEEEKRA